MSWLSAVIVDSGVAQVLASGLGKSAEGENVEWGLSPCGIDDWRLTGAGTNEDWGLSPGRTLDLKTSGGGVKGSSSGTAEVSRVLGEKGAIEENDDFGRVLLVIVSPLNAGFYHSKSAIESQTSFTTTELTGGTKVSSESVIDTG